MSNSHCDCHTECLAYGVSNALSYSALSKSMYLLSELHGYNAETLSAKVFSTVSVYTKKNVFLKTL